MLELRRTVLDRCSGNTPLGDDLDHLGAHQGSKQSLTSAFAHLELEITIGLFLAVWIRGGLFLTRFVVVVEARQVDRVDLLQSQQPEHLVQPGEVVGGCGQGQEHVQ